MATLTSKFLDRGMFDEAVQFASTVVTLAQRFYGPNDAQSLLAVVNLANVHTQQGSFHHAFQLGEAAVSALKKARGDYDGDVLQSEYLLCETLLELDQLDRAKTLCSDVLRRKLEISRPRP